MSESATKETHGIFRAWAHFEKIVKHESRFFFHTLQLNPDSGKDSSPFRVFRTLRSLASHFGLINDLPEGAILYRARRCDESWRGKKPLAADLGPPPCEKARPGRMNPAGIAYCYLAETPDVAIAEVMERPPSNIVVATFETLTDFRLLDLTALPEQDDDMSDNQKIAVEFFQHFRDAITKPVESGWPQAIDYLPSQVVCEYFALSHRLPDKQGHIPGDSQRIDGIKYRSTIHPAGKNIVLFPPENGWKEVDGRVSDALEFSGWEKYEIDTWQKFEQLTGELGLMQKTSQISRR